MEEQPSTSKLFISSRTEKMVEMAISECRNPRAAKTKATEFLRDFNNSDNYEQPLFDDDSNDSNDYRPNYEGK